MRITAKKDLTTYRTAATAMINDASGEVRARFITIAPGQDLIYMRKEAEAIRYLAQDPEPNDLAPYPFIRSELGITADTPWELAQLWVNMAAMFEEVGALLENARLGAVVGVENATTLQEIDTITATFRGAIGNI